LHFRSFPLPLGAFKRISVTEAAQSPRLVRFESFEVNLRSGELWNHGEKVKLQEQSFQILAMLLAEPGEVVMRQEIQKKLWPNDTVVEFENSINAAVKKLRLALGDPADQPRYIETLARRGYRWMVPVEWGEEPVHAATSAAGVGPAAAYLLGKKVSHYRVLEVLGGGGMGVVYKAEDLKLGRPVALKFLPEELGTDPKALERFEREARAASAPDHPNICTIHEFGEHEGQPFIVMQFLEGHTLRERLAASVNLSRSSEDGIAGPLPPAIPFTIEEVLELAIQIANGLEAAHQKGIIHRDIKPANIFITDRGEAKILDFGLAKVVAGESAGVASEQDHHDGPRAASALPSLDLSQTGIAMGTASYMSPEQVRGEKLDQRTDLFSFGLVLYEMATGQQAFVGDTAPAVHDAILHRPTRPARQLNPAAPTELEQIISKALEKDRHSRYQRAAEICADLKRLRPEQPTRRVRWPIAAAIALSMLLVAGTLFWFARRRPSSPPELKLRQLTASSSEDPVRYGAISPDGKYLAFADLKGIHIMLIKTGETRTVPQPEAYKGSRVDWQFFRWFPDGTSFLVNQNPPPERELGYDATIWAVSVLGGAPRKLRDAAGVESISPDGSLVAFTTDIHNVWLMGPDGEQARKLYDTGTDGEALNFRFSPDGQRLAYTGYPDDALESRDLKGGPPVKMLSGVADRLRDYVWLPDGRMVYTLAEPSPNVDTCNLWELRVDTRTGQPRAAPRRLTNWAGFCADNLSVTADGKQIVFREWAGHGSVYVADLQLNGTRITTPSRLTVSESWNVPSAWTADSKAVIFSSKFNGEVGIFQQRLDQDTPQPLVTGLVSVSDHTPLTPDGSWFIYTATSGPAATEQFMRVPTAGGSPQPIMPGDSYGVRCARPPATLCAIAESSPEGTQLIFTTFDPLKGRAGEITRLDITPDPYSTWDLSPDGTRFAVFEGVPGRIHILSRIGQAAREIKVRGIERTKFLDWTADGKALLVSRPTRRGFELLYLDLKGNSHVLWEQRGSLGTSAIPSPDGRHLAIQGWSMNSNLWMMGNF
jgi:eukaryotic-like serine/threonine-protein kinase